LTSCARGTSRCAELGIRVDLVSQCQWSGRLWRRNGSLIGRLRNFRQLNGLGRHVRRNVLCYVSVQHGFHKLEGLFSQGTCFVLHLQNPANLDPTVS
jgi:hypothetical protein